MAGPNTLWAPVHRALQRWGNPGNAGFPMIAAPSMDYLASGIQDHRLPYNARGSGPNMPGIIGWYGGGDIVVAHYVPSAIATANIAALANAVSGTPMTLVSSSGAGITVLTPAAPANFFPNPASTVVSAGVVIDGLPSLHTFGGQSTSHFNTSFYNRGTYVGRAISITGVSGGAGGAFLVAGLDIYGYPLTQLVTVGAGVNTVNSLKTFKAILSVTPQFSDAHTYSVGTADVYGLGIYAAFFGDVQIQWNNANVTANTGFLAGVTTIPSTNLLGDVRGTYAVQSASDGTKRLVIGVNPTPASLATNPTTGLFGQPQV